MEIADHVAAIYFSLSLSLSLSSSGKTADGNRVKLKTKQCKNYCLNSDSQKRRAKDDSKAIFCIILSLCCRLVTSHIYNSQFTHVETELCAPRPPDDSAHSGRVLLELLQVLDREV